MNVFSFSQLWKTLSGSLTQKEKESEMTKLPLKSKFIKLGFNVFFLNFCIGFLARIKFNQGTIYYFDKYNI